VHSASGRRNRKDGSLSPEPVASHSEVPSLARSNNNCSRNPADAEEAVAEDRAAQHDDSPREAAGAPLKAIKHTRIY
jgi:hypothetical protein